MLRLEADMARAIVVKKASGTAAGKPGKSPVAKAKAKARKPSKRPAEPVVMPRRCRTCSAP
jgi:hypothetical protein